MYAHASQLNAQEKLISGGVAAGMHLLFLALLVFGVNWQKHIEPPVNMVDLWSPPAPVAEAPPAPPPEPAPPPPPQEVKPEPKLRTPAPVKAVPKPEAVKPDITFKDKKDKEREKEREKDKRAEEKKQQDARKKEQEAQQAQAAEAQRVANEQAEAQRRVAEQAVAAQVRLIDEYKSRIQAQIYKAMQPFDDLPKDTFAEIEITVLPDGNVLSTVVKKNSASARFNEAVERAVLKAQPLPVPKGKDAALFADNFRRMTLVFRPKQ
jgi:colicin import membrane protein